MVKQGKISRCLCLETVWNKVKFGLPFQIDKLVGVMAGRLCVTQIDQHSWKGRW